MRDIVFEAAFLRDAVLVGLVHERQVPEWATDLLAADMGPTGALAELLSVPAQLSPIREALHAFGEVEVPSRVTGALLTRARASRSDGVGVDAANHLHLNRSSKA